MSPLPSIASKHKVNTLVATLPVRIADALSEIGIDPCAKRDNAESPWILTPRLEEVEFHYLNRSIVSSTGTLEGLSKPKRLVAKRYLAALSYELGKMLGQCDGTAEVRSEKSETKDRIPGGKLHSPRKKPRHLGRKGPSKMLDITAKPFEGKAKPKASSVAEALSMAGVIDIFRKCDQLLQKLFAPSEPPQDKPKVEVNPTIAQQIEFIAQLLQDSKAIVLAPEEQPTLHAQPAAKISSAPQRLYLLLSVIGKKGNWPNLAEFLRVVLDDTSDSSRRATSTKHLKLPRHAPTIIRNLFSWSDRVNRSCSNLTEVVRRKMKEYDQIARRAFIKTTKEAENISSIPPARSYRGVRAIIPEIYWAKAKAEGKKRPVRFLKTREAEKALFDSLPKDARNNIPRLIKLAARGSSSKMAQAARDEIAAMTAELAQFKRALGAAPADASRKFEQLIQQWTNRSNMIFEAPEVARPAKAPQSSFYEQLNAHEPSHVAGYFINLLRFYGLLEFRDVLGGTFPSQSEIDTALLSLQSDLNLSMKGLRESFEYSYVQGSSEGDVLNLFDGLEEWRTAEVGTQTSFFNFIRSFVEGGAEPDADSLSTGASTAVLTVQVFRNTPLKEWPTKLGLWKIVVLYQTNFEKSRAEYQARQVKEHQRFSAKLEIKLEQVDPKTYKKIKSGEERGGFKVAKLDDIIQP